MVQFQPTNVDSNNTERIHISYGHQPTATIGHASQGEVLLQGSAVDEPSHGRELAPRYKKAVWATSSKTNQSVFVSEEIEKEKEVEKT